MNNILASKELKISLLSPPGDTLREHLEYIGLSVCKLSEKIEIPLETINRIIAGSEPITPFYAQKLEQALGIPSIFWLNREKEYSEKLNKFC